MKQSGVFGRGLLSISTTCPLSGFKSDEHAGRAEAIEIRQPSIWSRGVSYSTIEILKCVSCTVENFLLLLKQCLPHTRYFWVSILPFDFQKILHPRGTLIILDHMPCKRH